ncbi:hypothetical protein BDR07DRAFT_1479626 [Suillus spraguei]|nr:hypothetical protein BDR07DRAFT_1479626 [Suillus spraguei]
MSQKDLALIYDHCLRPTLAEVLPEFADRVPTSYTAAYMQSKTRAGGLAFNTLDVPWNRLEEVAATLLAKLQEQRGTIHDGEKDWERHMAFQDMFEHVDIDNLDPREWLVDVALTIGVEGHVVTWRESCHQDLMPLACPRKVAALTRNRKKFHLDRTLQIQELAGFRATTTNFTNGDGITYVQAYCAERNVTYQLNPGVFRRRQPKELLQKKTEQKIVDYLDVTSQVFYECAGEEDVEGRDGCACLENWIPLDKAQDILVTLPCGLIERSVVAINRRVWWLFIYYRLAAIRLVLKNLAKADPSVRALNPMLGLEAVCLHMMNACFTHPAEGFGWEKNCCQRVLEDLEADDEDAPTVPILYDSGTYFICDSVMNTGRTTFLRLPLQRTFDSESMARIYHKKSINDVKASFDWSVVVLTIATGTPEMWMISEI